MKQEICSSHFTDVSGTPAGGQTYGCGFCIAWQNGPLGRGEDRDAPNGAFVESVIEAAKDRIEFYQSTMFACEENASAIEFLRKALLELKTRTDRRESQGVEGTHQGN